MAWTSSSSRRMVASALFVFLLLLVASETTGGPARVAEARRHCLSQSHKFVGGCMRKSNCENVCKTEGFPWGECKWHGMEPKCYCKRLC